MELKDITKQKKEVAQGVDELDQYSINGLARVRDYQSRKVTKYLGRSILQMLWEIGWMQDKKAARDDLNVVENFEWKPGLKFLLEENWRKMHYNFNTAGTFNMSKRGRSEMKEKGVTKTVGSTITKYINFVGIIEIDETLLDQQMRDLLLVKNNLFSESGNFNGSCKL